MRKGVGLLLIIVMIFVSFSVFGAGQTDTKYPTKAIDLVIAASPGAGSDVLARLIARYLSQELGQPVNVINQGGGNGIPAVQTVMNARPDGYTLLADQALSSSYQLNLSNLPYKVEDRTFIAMAAKGPMVLVCNPRLPWKTLADVAEFARNNPQDFIWGGLGGSSAGDFVQLQFFNQAGIDVSKTKKLVYSGGGEILASVAGGHAQFGVSAASGVPPFVQSGNVRALVTSGSQRVAVLSDVPNAVEAGFDQVDIGFWVGLTGPKNLPSHVVETLDNAIAKIVEMDSFKADLDRLAIVPHYLSTTDMKNSIIAEGAAAKLLAGLGQ